MRRLSTNDPRVVAPLFVTAYFGLNELARAFASPDVLFLWYPPAALSLALLWLGTPWYGWLIVLAGGFSATFDLDVWSEPWRVLPFALGNAAAYVMGAWLLKQLKADPALSTRRDALIFFFVGGMGATLLAATLGGLGLIAGGFVDGQDTLDTIGKFWIGDIAGVTTFGPALMLLLTRGLHLGTPGESRWRSLERLITLVITGVCAWLSTAAWTGEIASWEVTDFQPMTLVILPMIWIALRERLAAVSLGILVVNVTSLAVGADYATGVGRTLTLQIAVATTALVGLVIATSVTLKVTAETAHQHDLLHDRLTGLPNEALFTDRLALALLHARTDGSTTAVLQLGLDDFATINESLGRPAGDHVLRTVAWRLATDLGSGQTVARLDGDTFGVLVSRSGPDADEQVPALAERLRRRLEPPVRVRGQEVFVRASVGVSTCLAGSQTADELAQDANTALHRAKTAGGGVVEIKDRDHNLRAQRQLQLDHALHAALAEPHSDVLSVYYQPIFDARSNRILGYEALLRFAPDELGQVPPAEVVALAESVGLGRRLTQRVLDTACGQLRSWSRARPGLPPRIAVNISAAQAEQETLIEDVTAALRTHDVQPQDLCLEITEDDLIGARGAVPQLVRLRELGVRISLDDFGTGYSSLAYLTQLPVDELKIDQSFVQALPDDRAAMAVVRATISIAAALGLEVVAEGVESTGQADVLRSLGIGRLQGFLYGPATPVEDLLNTVPEQRSDPV